MTVRTRNILNRNYPFDIVGHMLHYGFGFGSPVGFCGSIPLAVILLNLQFGLPLIAFTFLISLFGGLFGIVFGVIAGFASGLIMGFVTQIFFRDIRWRKVYKLVMGFITFVVTMTTFIPIWFGLIDSSQVGVQLNAWHSLWIMSLVFAVYASQRTASKYLRHADVRKAKVG